MTGRLLTLPRIYLAVISVIAVWALAWLQNSLAYDLWVWSLGAEEAILLLALIAAAFVVLEEPLLEPHGTAALGRLQGAMLLLGLGEAMLYPLARGKDTWAGLGFASLAAGAALIWPSKNKAAWALAWFSITALAVVGLIMVLQRETVLWDLFAAYGAAKNSPFLWLFLVMALGSLAWGASSENPAPMAEAPLSRFWEISILLLIFAFGAALRFYKPGQVPQGIWYDEIARANSLHELLMKPQGQFWRALMGEPGAFMDMEGVLFKVFGEQVQVLRVAAGAFGLLAILPFWALAKIWLGQRWALAASLAFACMHWVLIQERQAFATGFAMFWILASFWALWSAQMRGGAARWFLAGLMLAADFHAREFPALLLPPATMAFLALQAFLDKTWRRPWKEWVAFGVGFALLAWPLLFLFGANGGHATRERTKEV